MFPNCKVVIHSMAFHLLLDIGVSMGSSCTPTIVDNITRRITDNMTTTTCERHHQRVTENNTHNQTDNQNLPCQSYYFIDDLVLEHQHRQ